VIEATCKVDSDSCNGEALLCGAGTITIEYPAECGGQTATKQCPACDDFMGLANVCRMGMDPPAACDDDDDALAAATQAGATCTLAMGAGDFTGAICVNSGDANSPTAKSPAKQNCCASCKTAGFSAESGNMCAAEADCTAYPTTFCNMETISYCQTCFDFVKESDCYALATEDGKNLCLKQCFDVVPEEEDSSMDSMDSMDYSCEWCPADGGIQMEKVISYNCMLPSDTTEADCIASKVNGEAFEFDAEMQTCELDQETAFQTECEAMSGTYEEMTCEKVLFAFELAMATGEECTSMTGDMTYEQTFQMMGCCGAVPPVQTCDFCNANGIEKPDMVFMKMCDVEIDAVTAAGMTCADLDALKGHAWGDDDVAEGETVEACIIEVMTKDEDAANALTAADCTGYTMTGLDSPVMKYEELKCSNFEMGMMSEDADSCDAVVTDFGLNMPYVDIPMELGCCMPTDTTVAPEPECRVCANDWAVADKCDGDERIAGDCEDCGVEVSLRCPMTNTTICSVTDCGEAAAEVGDECWLASATACAEGSFSAASCAKCDWTKEDVSDDCYTAIAAEVTQVCLKPQTVKQGMRFDGLTADNFADTKPSLIKTLAGITGVEEANIDATYTGTARRMLQRPIQNRVLEDRNTDTTTEAPADNVEAVYTVNEADAADLETALADDTFVASVNTGLTNEGVTGITAASVSATTKEAVTTTMPPTLSPTDPAAETTTAPVETTPEAGTASAGALSMVAAFVAVFFM